MLAARVEQEIVTPFDWSKSSINACRLSSLQQWGRIIGINCDVPSLERSLYCHLIRDILQASPHHCLRTVFTCATVARGLSSRKSPRNNFFVKAAAFRRMSGSFPDMQPTRKPSMGQFQFAFTRNNAVAHFSLSAEQTTFMLRLPLFS